MRGPYLYEDTDVLKNKLDIKEQSLLDDEKADYVVYRLKDITMNVLIENIERIHTTDMGVDRIRRNLGLGNVDVVEWCKEKIIDPNAIIERHGN